MRAKYPIAGGCLSIGAFALNQNQGWLGCIFIVVGSLMLLHGFLQWQRLGFPADIRRVFMTILLSTGIGVIFLYPFIWPPVEQKIVLYERYAEQWQGQQPYSINLTQGKVLRKHFSSTESYRFTPAVGIEKDGPILKDVKIVLTLPHTFKASWTGGWVENYPGVYAADINDFYKNAIQKGRGVSVASPLLINVTQAIKDDAPYRLTGTVRDGEKERSFKIDGKFTIDIFK